MVKGKSALLDIDKIHTNESQLYTSSKVTNAKTEKEYQDFWNPAKDDEEFEKTLKREGYEYTPLPDKY